MLWFTRFQQACLYQDMTLVLRSQIIKNDGEKYNRLLQSSDWHSMRFLILLD